jgi:dTDP-4-amino-4,6-dideoxygalactose transaminase
MLASELPGLAVVPGDNEVYRNMLIVYCAPFIRYQLASFLADHGVETTWLYYPLHLVGRYASFATGRLTLSERIWPQILCFPCRGWHSPAQIKHVLKTLGNFFAGLCQAEWQRLKAWKMKLEEGSANNEVMCREAVPTRIMG